MGLFRGGGEGGEACGWRRSCVGVLSGGRVQTWHETGNAAVKVEDVSPMGEEGIKVQQRRYRGGMGRTTKPTISGGDGIRIQAGG
jgi:hypothetical protein